MNVSPPISIVDGIPTAVAGVANGAIVYRTGIATAPPFYETWAEIQTIIAAAVSAGSSLPVTVVIDGAATGGVAVIPGGAGATECAGLVTLESASILGPSGVSQLFIEDGATLSNLYAIDGRPAGSSTWEILYDCTTTPAFSFFGNNDWFLYNVSFNPTAGSNIVVNVDNSFTVNGLDAQFQSASFFSLDGVALSIFLRSAVDSVGTFMVDDAVVGSGLLDLYYDAGINSNNPSPSQPFPQFPTLLGNSGAVNYNLVPGVYALIPTGFGQNVTADYNANPGEVVHVDASGGGVTITLPIATSGIPIVVKATVLTSNSITVTGPEQIDDAGFYTINPVSSLIAVTFVYNVNGNYDIVSVANP